MIKGDLCERSAKVSISFMDYAVHSLNYGLGVFSDILVCEGLAALAIVARRVATAAQVGGEVCLSKVSKQLHSATLGLVLTELNNAIQVFSVRLLGNSIVTIVVNHSE